MEKFNIISEERFKSYLNFFLNSSLEGEEEWSRERKLLIVLAEHDLRGDRDDFFGVDDAFNYAKKHPEEDVLLLSFLSAEELTQIKTKSALFFYLKNAFFWQLPLGDSFSLKFLKRYSNYGFVKEEAAKFLKSLVAVLNHRTERYLDSSEEEIQKVLLAERTKVQELQTYFSELKDLQGVDFISQLKKINSELKIVEVMPNQEINGVYCDVEGTLYKDGEIQKEVVKLLQNYSQQGLPVTIWTLGDTQKYQTLVREAGIGYPVINKLDCSGAIAEIVIDDEPEVVFRSRTGIKSKKFIQI